MPSSVTQSPSGLPNKKKRHFEIRRLTRTPRGLARLALRENQVPDEAVIDYRVIGPQVRLLLAQSVEQE